MWLPSLALLILSGSYDIETKPYTEHFLRQRCLIGQEVLLANLLAKLPDAVRYGALELRQASEISRMTLGQAEHD